MTQTVSRLRGFFALAALASAAVAASATTAAAQQVQASAQVLNVVENGAFIDVQLRVAVANGESAVASNVVVAFEDGLQVSLGDVAAGQSAVSTVQTESIDISTKPTHNVPVPVSVKFVLNGQSVESAQTLLVKRPTAPDPVQ